MIAFEVKRMRLCVAGLIFSLTTSCSVACAQIAGPGISLTGEILLAEGSAQQQSLPPGYAGGYRSVQPQQKYQRACGTVATDICPVAVNVPVGATGAQVYAMAKNADANGQKGQSMWLLQKSAELGYVTAEGALGLGYLKGIGLPNDQAKGVYWLTQAANQGSAKADVELGLFYEDGSNGMNGNEPRAIAYLKAGAAQRDPLAEYRLGLDYEIGRGVAHNRAAAMEWLRRAAADGRAMGNIMANFLANSRVPQFRSAEELDAAMNPGARPLTNKEIQAQCGPAQDFVDRGDFIPQYCTRHPLCPYTKNNTSYTCPAAQF